MTTNTIAECAALRVAILHETFPTTCAIVQQVRDEYADWYYDLPDGYLRYYRWATSLFEHRLVAERVFGLVPRGYVIRHLNNDRTDNRIENLRFITRAENAAMTWGRAPAPTYLCAICGKTFKGARQRLERSLSGQLFCSPACRQFAQRKVEHPTAEELLRLMQEIGNWTRLAQHFGVSDNAVRKWAKRYDLDLSLCDGRRKA